MFTHDYFLISYIWKRKGNQPQHAMMVWEGTVAQWALMATQQPEKWTLLNSEGISADQHRALVSVVG